MQLPTTDLEPIDFGSPHSNTAPIDRENLYRLGQRILAIMGWPKDEIRRRKFLAAAYATQIAHIGAAPMPHGFPTNRADLWETIQCEVSQEVLTRDFLPVGGYASVAAADPLEKQFAQLRKRTNDWISVSAQLWICRSIAVHHSDIAKGGASISKARHILSDCSRWNWTELEENWAKFRSVAHLCAAIDLLDGGMAWAKNGEIPTKRPPGGVYFFEGLPFLLAIARDYQNWATDFVPMTRREPLVSSNHLWFVGPHTPPWDLPSVVPKLNDLLLQSLAGYKAPTRDK